MTALTQYDRLEAPGLWRDAPEAQRRDVIVSVGKATLVISDSRTGRALSHWSLPAVERLNPGAMPALFAPGPDATEDLELDDTTMIAALARVHTIIEARKPHPGRLRLVLLLSGLALVLAGGFIWVPGAVKAHATRALPAEKRTEIGQAILADVFRVSGAACAGPEGRESLARLDARLGGTGPGGIIILSSGLEGSRHLPGGTILVGRSLVEDQSTPEALAGHVLAERSLSETEDPLAKLLDWTGVGAAFSLLTTGNLPEDSILGYAESLLTSPPSVPAPAKLAERFREAGLATTPFAQSPGVDPALAATLKDIDPFRDAPSNRPLLSDTDWVALQGICAN